MKENLNDMFEFQMRGVFGIWRLKSFSEEHFREYSEIPAYSQIILLLKE